MYDYEFSVIHERVHRDRLLAAAEAYRLVKAAREANSGRSSARQERQRPD